MAKDFRTNVEVTGTLTTTGATTVGGNFTASTNTSTLSTTTNIGGTSNQRITLTSGAGTHGIEIGRTDSVASTPFIDFHSSSVTNDFDARLIANGSSSVAGEAQLTVYGSLWMQNKGIGSTAAANTFASVTVSSGNLTVSTGNLTVSAGTTTLGTTNTGTITSTASVIGSIVHANSNGAGTNFRVGDDIWIGDINAADTMSIRGISGASSNGYIRFGSDTNSLGYNGSIFSYAQGIVISPQMVRLDAVRTKPTNDTSLEPIFDAANDTISIDAGSLYYFKGIFQISKTATGSAAGIQLGFTFSNSPQNVNYKYSSHTQAIGTVQGGLGTVATATTVTATGTVAANYVIEIEGWFKSNATTGGTFAPTFTQSVAGTSTAPTANANSWFMIQEMSSTVTTTNITGGWS